MRPQGLPEFENPPLNEVFLGVQFAPVRGYQQIHIGEVHKLFSDRFPLVQEQMALPPTFETFGLPTGQQMNFGLVSGAMHDRFWFSSLNAEELIQFQNDRLIHNWRKVGDLTNQYPRFEYMIENFKAELSKFEGFSKNLSGADLTITQAEICYTNHIPLTGLDAFKAASSVFRFLDFGGRDPDDISATFRRVIRSDDGTRPIGRLICDITSAIQQNGNPMIIFALTARAAPIGSSLSAAIDFLKSGREVIVHAFKEFTSESAHSGWKLVI
jgi:uncharacterized protein (TIGR04255 family)